MILKHGIFWLSYLVFPLLWLAGREILQRRRWRRWAMVAAVPMVLFTYGRFIEPRILLTKTHEFELCGDGLPGQIRVAVAADFHQGIFPNAMPVKRIVSAVNKTDADVLLIPGDFTYHLSPEKFSRAFGAMASLEMPTYAVMGNHDVGMPGPDLSADLTEKLEEMGVTVLNPGVAEVRVGGRFLRIVGTRDYWDYTLRGNDLGEMPNYLDMATIYLQHNPDLIRDPSVGQFDLMVSGHTHGGQVYLPWITCLLTFACDTLRYGYAELPKGAAFVTSGTGMVGLPIRFGVPPRVDVLDVTINRCRAAFERAPKRRMPGSPELDWRNNDQERPSRPPNRPRQRS